MPLYEPLSLGQSTVGQLQSALLASQVRIQELEAELSTSRGRPVSARPPRSPRVGASRSSASSQQQRRRHSRSNDMMMFGEPLSPEPSTASPPARALETPNGNGSVFGELLAAQKACKEAEKQRDMALVQVEHLQSELQCLSPAAERGSPAKGTLEHRHMVFQHHKTILNRIDQALSKSPER
eukprot:TRINITY_DN23998_c0_g1_i1.p1 TRINITY_DN23998_c0_g1~~TRINITY_DN23998_c0_g1_i1.p1  ORF type:complete len:182 (+),score=34.25 TRINITY_DN23998_c0_g1_i1:251-796(+)